MWQASDAAGGWLQSKPIYVNEDRITTKYNSEGNDNTSAEKERTYYYHSDHLGSAQTVTNYKGQVHERLEYTPYGELWIDWRSDLAPEDSTPFRFPGKELDPETGLYYYGARYLDPKTSRWLSGDPAMGEYFPVAPVDDEAKKRNGNLPGQGGVFNYVNLHAYHYAGNNPVKYVDPDGEALTTLIKSGSAGSISSEGTYQDFNNYYKIISAKHEYSSNFFDKINNLITGGGALAGISNELINAFGTSPALEKFGKLVSTLGNVSTVVSIVLMFMPDKIGNIKKQLDNIAQGLLDEIGKGSLSQDRISVTFTTERTYKVYQHIPDHGFSYNYAEITDTRYMDVAVDGKSIGKVEINSTTTFTRDLNIPRLNE
jgi:RHS repeat-associated protein